MTSLNAALSYLTREISAIPVPPPDDRHDGKVPALAWKPYQDRLPTEDEIREWFAREQNIALVCGAVSDLVCIDADSRDAMAWAVRRLPYTPWQTRTPRGFHLYYRHPGVPVPNRARIETKQGRLALDVRGDHGYAIAAPSLHRTGARYELAGNWDAPRNRVPRFWPGWLQRSKRSVGTSPILPRPTGDLTERGRRYLAAIERPEIGKGSDAATLYAACRLVRGFGLSESDAVALLWEWAGSRPGWTEEWIAEKVQHAARYGTEPIGALR